MKDLEQYIEDKVNEMTKILDGIKFEDEELNSMIKYCISGGRGLRSALVFLSCETVGGGWKKSVPAATAIELMHKFTLIHDDIIDEDEERRGRSTVHRLYGQKNAIILGDIMSTLSLNVLNKLDSHHTPKTIVSCYEVLSETLNKLCEGEIKDLILKVRDGVDENEYFDMVYEKTAYLIESACRVGSIVGSGTDEEMQVLSKFGRNFGMSFQIINDVNNLMMEKKYSKRRGSDLRQGKLTLMVLKTHLSGSMDERDRLHAVLNKKNCSDKHLDEVIEMLIKNGSIDYAMKKAKGYADKARACIADIQDSESKELLLNVVDHITTETYWKGHTTSMVSL